MNEEIKNALFQIQKIAHDLDVGITELKQAIIKDELRRKGRPIELEGKEREIYAVWYKFYTDTILLDHEDADFRARRRVDIHRKYSK